MNRRSVLRLLGGSAVIAGLAGTGCARYRAPERPLAPDVDLVGESYRAADALLANTPWLREQQAPLLVASFVNINSLENSSALGRIVAEQIASRFAQQGFTVIELKLRNNIFIKQNAGEFALSRDVQAISRSHNAAAVIAGSYAIGRHNVYVNARLIRAPDSLILAAYDYSIPLGPDARALLASQ